MTSPTVVRASGALIEVSPVSGASLFELVRVGERQLLGEIVGVEREVATIQVYEETAGLRVGEPVELSGESLAVNLGPGLLGSVLDGVGRPLERLAERSGPFIAAGASAPTLDPERTWSFTPALEGSVEVMPGDVLGSVEERPGFVHRVLVPPGVSGTLARLKAGEVTVEYAIGELADGAPLRLSQRWPIRMARPVTKHLASGPPLITGQRIFDFLFPVAEGGSVAVPGGFGTGKTVIEHSLAKYAEADVIVFIGCGERGNEMAEVLSEFPGLVDPRTGSSLMDRTVLIVNTSNMPVAAREASVYLGLTIAEYYRDMGYRVAVMADSLSRWAEALREISSRLQEMPGEEGFPTYLAGRLGRAYERAGRVEVLGRPSRHGSLTLVSAISPPGGDFSEPVTQASLRVAGALWALDPGLAHQRQFPAVDWETSYSLYTARTLAWFEENAAPDWGELRRQVLDLLERDAEIREIAGLVGPEALQEIDRLTLETASLVREIVLGQNAFDPNDASSSIAKTHLLASLAMTLHREAGELLASGVPMETLDLGTPRRALARLRDASEDRLEASEREARAAVARIGQPRGEAR